MSESEDTGRSRLVWSAEEVNEQLDEVAEALIQGAGEFVQGFFFGAPRRPRPKPPSRKPEERQQ